MKQVVLFTDGSCLGNPGPGGWACLLRCGSAQRELTGSEPDTTNNRMELRAVIAGLSALKERCKVRVVTDSQYVQRRPAHNGAPPGPLDFRWLAEFARRSGRESRSLGETGAGEQPTRSDMDLGSWPRSQRRAEPVRSTRARRCSFGGRCIEPALGEGSFCGTMRWKGSDRYANDHYHRRCGDQSTAR